MKAVECVYHTGPVTAIHVLGNLVISGCGDYLYVYDVETRQCIQRLSVLPCTRIHGIRSASGLLCVFGEKRSCIVEVEKGVLIETERKVELKDLIWDAQFLKDKDEVVFALAHNTIVRWDSYNGHVLDVIRCEENSILYCARFLTTDWDNLILAAGTVFNQVLLWSPKTPKNSTGCSPVLHRFEGHQGVIFSVRYNSQRKQICSVSDDRSIRIWQLTFPEKITMAADEPDLDDWVHCQSTSLHVLYGHSARVWDVNLLTDVMISVGEDSLCCVWNYNGEIIQKFKGHKGKSIWSLDADKDERYFVTGGGDNSIRLWKLQQTGDQSSQQIQCQSLPFTEKDDFVRVVSFWRSDFVLGITDGGSLLVYSLSNGSCKVIFTDKNFRSYTVMSVSNVVAIGNIKGTLRLLSAKETGSDSLEEMEFVWRDFDMYKGKVFSIQWLSPDYILTTGPEGHIHCYELCTEGNDLGVLNVNLVKTYILPYCKQRWVSTASLTTDGRSLICGDRAGTIHVYRWGGQDGQLLEPVQSFWKIHGKAGVTDILSADDMVYTAGRDGHYRKFKVENNQLVLLNSNRVSKGFDWLDKLELQPNSDMYIYGFQSDSFVIFSLDNNQRLVQIPCGGGHRTWDCQIVDDKVKFVYLKMKEVVLCDTDLLTNQVILKESLHGRETISIKHLFEYLSESNKPVSLVLTCSEDTTILISKLTYNDFGVLSLSNLHTLRDHISNVKCITLCMSPASGNHLVFSGGARAQLVITKIIFQKNSGSCEIKTSFQTLKLCHLNEEWLSRKQKKSKFYRSNPETRIMDLCVIPIKEIISDCPDHLFILGSACSDGYIRFFIFDEKFKDLIQLCDSLYHNHCVLKIAHTFISTSDVRQSVFLSAGTDGKVALWDISKQISTFLLKYNTINDQDNQNKLKNFESKVCNRNDRFDTSPNIVQNNRLVASCDQNVDFVDGNNISINQYSKKPTDNTTCSEGDEIQEPLFVIPCHQSGVNGISTLDLKGGRVLVASGGDDNALVLSIVSVHGNTVTLVGQTKELSAHSAQITGVHIINSTKILTASVDQRMCLWEVCLTDSIPRLSLVGCKFVNVPDISHMEVWQNENRLTVGITGEGLTIFEIEKNKI